MKETVQIKGFGPLVVVYEDDGDNFDINQITTEAGYDLTAFVFQPDLLLDLIQDEIMKERQSRADQMRYNGGADD